MVDIIKLTHCSAVTVQGRSNVIDETPDKVDNANTKLQKFDQLQQLQAKLHQLLELRKLLELQKLQPKNGPCS